MNEITQDNTAPTEEVSAYIKPKLVKSILETIAFYDLFDFPLMAEEIQDDLYKYSDPLHAKELRATLDYLVEIQVLSYLKDYYVFSGREPIIETRKTRKFLAEKFWNRTKLYGQYMRAVPFVKMIAVCNNLSYDNPAEQSDIDLFIVIKPGRMWTARLLITLILQFYGVRRHGKYVTGRFCLSFFVTEKALQLEPLALQPEDPYLAYWAKNLSPVYGEEAFEKFCAQNEEWLKNYGMRFTEDQKRNMYFYTERKTKRFFEWLFGGILGDFMEWILKQTLKKRTLKKAKKADALSNLIVTDDILKFHNHDRRQEYYEKWKSKWSELLAK